MLFTTHPANIHMHTNKYIYTLGYICKYILWTCTYSNTFKYIPTFWYSPLYASTRQSPNMGYNTIISAHMKNCAPLYT
jgi:hypothetical protein